MTHISMCMWGGKMNIYRNYVKRIMDIFLSFIAIFILLPLILLFAFLVKIKLGSPILFFQERPGKDEKIFRLYKFRSMSEEKDKEGHYLPDEKRLTRFGRKLRSTSLDELPELFSILKGDMSIVGPRPLLIEYLPYYTEIERKRHKVRPGLTGLAQVEGRNYLSWDERLKKDVAYVEQISFWLDCKIIVKTFINVIRQKGVAEDTSNIEGNLANIRRELYKKEEKGA